MLPSGNVCYNLSAVTEPASTEYDILSTSEVVILNSAGLKISTRVNVEAYAFKHIHKAANKATDICFTDAERVEFFII